MYQAFRRGLSRPLAGMEMRGPGANHRSELLSSMASYCISWPGSDRSFALTVPRPRHAPDVPLADQPDRGSEGSSRRTSIIFPLGQHGPD
jgi:hypothetical protein